MKKAMLGKSSKTPETAVQPAEKARLLEALEKAEKAIQAGLKAFVVTGQELRRIRDEHLYRGADDEIFEKYVQRRWKMKKAHAYRFIKGAECFENVSKLETLVLPMTESQVRPMVSLSASQQQEAWMAALKLSGGGQPTAKQVSAAVATVTGKVKVPKAKPAKELASSDIFTELKKLALATKGDDGQQVNRSIDMLLSNLRLKVELLLDDHNAENEDTSVLMTSVQKHTEDLLEAVEQYVRRRHSATKAAALVA